MVGKNTHLQVIPQQRLTMQRDPRLGSLLFLFLTSGNNQSFFDLDLVYAAVNE